MEINSGQHLLGLHQRSTEVESKKWTAQIANTLELVRASTVFISSAVAGVSRGA